MKIDVEQIVRGMQAAAGAFHALEDAVDAFADVLHGQDQPELKRRLAALRAENDAARARRRAKLEAAVLEGEQ